MMAVMSFLLMYQNHLKTASEVYDNLRAKEEVFIQEARVVLFMKCALLNGWDMHDLNLDSYAVDIFQNGNTYRVSYEDIVIDLEISEDKLYDYELISFDN